MIEVIQPIVLAGGASTRFGRDKLQEPFPGPDGQPGLLVDHAVHALRAVFGNRVAMVGACAQAVRDRGDTVIADRYPGIGPLGGVLSALEQSRTSVLVVAGDLATISGTAVRSIVTKSVSDPAALAIVAKSSAVEWCVGLYRPSVVEYLSRAVESRDYALKRAIPLDRVAFADVPERLLRNVNCLSDLSPRQ